MTFDPDAAYQAILSRDARFDGHLFVGVTSTGIYCRPICRVRAPMRKNCRFFASHAQAEAAAFRPCLKCRPEIAPGRALPWTVMDASQTLARQASIALDAGSAGAAHATDAGTPSVAALAARLGVSDRHLRRIFFAEHGVTPLQYAQTRRLLLAKHLLTDTRLAVSEIALSSGFKSLRRFNAAFADSYRMNPSRLRRMSQAAGPGLPADAVITVRLGYRAPLDLRSVLRFVDGRAVPRVEAVDGHGIRRTVRAGTLAPVGGWLEAVFIDGVDQVKLTFSPSLGPFSGAVVAAVRRWLDLDAAPTVVDAALADLPGAPGLRLPGTLDGFELAVRAVLGQQITVAAARTLARRLVDRFGAAIETPWPGIDRSFPSPEALAAAPLERIAELGIVRTRAAAIVALAGRWHEIDAHLGRRAAPGPLIERLCELPGIGPWTAHYIAMRALGWPDAFPPNDIAALKAMRQLFDTASHREAIAHVERWRPWRAYALLRLWNSLEKTT